MSEPVAGFGTDWLPASVRRRMAAEDARERAEAARGEARRAERAESAYDRAVAAYRAQCAARGEMAGALDLVAGRSVADVLADAQAAADREDARARREHGEGPMILPFSVPRAMAVGEEPDRELATRSEAAREAADVRRHWRDRLDARRRLDALDGVGPVYFGG